MLTAASHELRGPLGVARGYLRLLAQSAALDPRSAKMVADAGRAAEKMAALLDELSQYARWVRGEQKLATAPALLNDIVADAVGATKVPAEQTSLTDGTADATVTVDRPRLTASLTALIVAASRAQAEDGAVQVQVREASGGGPCLRIGPARLLAGQWDERAVAIERGGAGLSLALACLIVERHGGRLVEITNGETWGYECRL